MDTLLVALSDHSRDMFLQAFPFSYSLASRPAEQGYMASVNKGCIPQTTARPARHDVRLHPDHTAASERGAYRRPKKVACRTRHRINIPD